MIHEFALMDLNAIVGQGLGRRWDWDQAGLGSCWSWSKTQMGQDHHQCTKTGSVCVTVTTINLSRCLSGLSGVVQWFERAWSCALPSCSHWLPLVPTGTGIGNGSNSKPSLKPSLHLCCLPYLSALQRPPSWFSVLPSLPLFIFMFILFFFLRGGRRTPSPNPARAPSASAS